MAEKEKKVKPAKESKADKQAAKDKKKELAQFQKEWENSIVSNKRVKREEFRRKFKRALLFLLVVSLIITSVVYIMLLFLDENNVRVTASSTKGKRISLSIDNEMWSPYLNGKGPDQMHDISYSKVYNKEEVPTIEDVKALLRDPENFVPGSQDKNGYICFGFMLRNDGDEEAAVEYEMTLAYDKVRNLQNCVRVMWGTSFKNDPGYAEVDVYAALSYDQRLYGTMINDGRTFETGFIEYIAYPPGSDNPRDENYNIADYERRMVQAGEDEEAWLNGFRKTKPFYSEDYVFKFDGENAVTLQGGDIMYCYVVIWLEGSDFECVDSAIGGYVKMNINFNAF